MITKHELRSIPNIYRQIQKDKEQLIFLREKATSLPSTLPDHERVQTSPSNNVNRYSDEASDLDKVIQIRQEELTDLQRKAKEYIDTLPQETDAEILTRRILKHRYLRCYTWREVAELTGYDIRTCCRYEFEAVREL